MNKEFDLAVTAIWNKYGKYGMQKQEIAVLMKSGMENNSLSLRAVYNGMRMSLAMEFNEQENFTVEDIMDITGESREEVVKRIEEMREEITATGGNPDDYARKVEAPKGSAFFFPEGV